MYKKLVNKPTHIKFIEDNFEDGTSTLKVKFENFRGINILQETTESYQSCKVYRNKKKLLIKIKSKDIVIKTKYWSNISQIPKCEVVEEPKIKASDIFSLIEDLWIS